MRRSDRTSEDAAVTALALAAGGGDRAALAEFIARSQSDVWRFLAHLTDADGDSKPAASSGVPDPFNPSAGEK